VFWTWRRQGKLSPAQLVQAWNNLPVRARRTKLREILAGHPEAKGVVIYLLALKWGVRLYQRLRQMALRFAEQGYLPHFAVWIDLLARVRKYHDTAISW
jgi:hypothetical protein